MTVAGVVLLVVAAGLVLWHVMARKRVAALLMAAPRGVGELRASAETIGRELGPGGFQEDVTVSGRAECPRPLTSPLAGRPCLYYELRVIREYEEEYEERAGDKVTRRTRRGTETVSTQREQCDFTLADDSGSVPVRLDGCRFEGLVETGNRFEPTRDGGGPTLRIGSLSVSLPAVASGRRTLGYRSQEQVLPLAPRLTVVGRATDDAGGLAIGRGGATFLVSTQAREAMLGGAKRTAGLTAAASGVSAVAGAVLLVLGLLAG